MRKADKICIQLFNGSCMSHGWTNFFVVARLFGRAIQIARPIGAKKRVPKPKVHVLEKTRNIAFYSLLPKYHLLLSFLMCFRQKFTQCDFCSLNVVLISKIRWASKNNFHNSSASILRCS